MDIKLIFIKVILFICLSYYWQRKIFLPSVCQDVFFFTITRVSLISKTEARNRMRIVQTGMSTMAEKLHAIKAYGFRILWISEVKMDELVTWFDIQGLLNRGSIHIIKDESNEIPFFQGAKQNTLNISGDMLRSEILPGNLLGIQNLKEESSSSTHKIINIEVKFRQTLTHQLNPSTFLPKTLRHELIS
jgi:hypothetical protein